MWGSTRALQSNDTVAETFVGAGYIDIAQVTVSAGDAIFPFQPRSYEKELELCQIKYERSYNAGTALGAVTAVGAVLYQTRKAIAASIAGPLSSPTVSFKKTKWKYPKITLYSLNGTANAVRVQSSSDRTGVTAGSVGLNGFAVVNIRNVSSTVIALG